MKHIISHSFLFFLLIAFIVACGKSNEALLRTEHAENDRYQAQNEIRWNGSIISGWGICLLLGGCCYIYYRKRKCFECAIDEKELDKMPVQLKQEVSKVEQGWTELKTICQDDIDEMDKYAAMEKELNRCKLLLSVKKDVPDLKESDIRSLSVFQSLQGNPCKAAIRTSEDWNLLFLWVDIAHRGFYTRLTVQYVRLKKPEIKICCLIRLGFDDDEILRILDIKRATYYVNKCNAKKQLLLGHEVAIEDFIHSF